MIEKVALNKKSILFSLALLCLSLSTFIYGAIIDRWPDKLFGPSLIYLTGFVLWLVWIFHLGWMLLWRRPDHGRRIRFAAEFLGAILGSMVLFVLVIELGSLVAKELRHHDIRMAVNAGLQRDCLNLLHNWPVTNDVIDMIDPSFTKLPQSIMMLRPVDIYNEKIDAPNSLPNIGVCRDGFGGGFYGIRVFQNDDDAKKLEASYGDHMCACERVAPGFYFWVDY